MTTTNPTFSFSDLTERNEARRAAEVDLAPGWEQRAVDRARAEGVLPTDARTEAARAEGAMPPAVDPLQGYSPEDIVVGPSGHTIADAAGQKST